MDKRPEQGAWEGNKLKHLSSNPLIKYAVSKLKEKIALFSKQCDPKTILDVGCGEGWNAIVVADHLPQTKIRAIDLEQEYIDYANKHHARPNITYEVVDLYTLDPKDKYDVVMCNEVLEHLDDFRKALEVLCSLSNKYVLISVPNEHWWRLANLSRLQYVKQLGNTPGHVNNWTRSQIRKLLSQYGKIKILKTSTMLWNVVLIEKD